MSTRHDARCLCRTFMLLSKDEYSAHYYYCPCSAKCKQSPENCMYDWNIVVAYQMMGKRARHPPAGSADEDSWLPVGS